MATKTITKLLLDTHTLIKYECKNESECLVNMYLNIIIVFIILPWICVLIVSSIIDNKPYQAIFQLLAFFFFYSIVE